MLLLNIWGHGGLSLDPTNEMQYVHRCMDVLKQCESRWYIAGRFW
jgi:hypothetical protein